MVENIDDLVLLLLRCDGKQAAITTYEEETGANHARAVRAVEKVARKHRVAGSTWTAWRIGIVIAAMVAVGAIYASLETWLTSSKAKRLTHARRTTIRRSAVTGTVRVSQSVRNPYMDRSTSVHVKRNPFTGRSTSVPDRL